MLSFARINPTPLTTYDRPGRTLKGKKQNVPFFPLFSGSPVPGRPGGDKMWVTGTSPPELARKDTRNLHSWGAGVKKS
jgi:hypothetical protein